MLCVGEFFCFLGDFGGEFVEFESECYCCGFCGVCCGVGGGGGKDVGVFCGVGGGMFFGWGGIVCLLGVEGDVGCGVGGWGGVGWDGVDGVDG